MGKDPKFVGTSVRVSRSNRVYTPEELQEMANVVRQSLNYVTNPAAWEKPVINPAVVQNIIQMSQTWSNDYVGVVGGNKGQFGKLLTVKVSPDLANLLKTATAYRRQQRANAKLAARELRVVKARVRKELRAKKIELLNKAKAEKKALAQGNKNVVA